jgi:hypothetical protein
MKQGFRASCGVLVRSLTVLALVLGLAACGKPARQDHLDSETQALTLLDQQDYGGAISYLEGAVASDPDYLPYRSLLANAHMGRAGLLLLPLANGILQARAPDTELYWQPVCDRAAVGTYSDLSVECGLFRLMRALPFAADNPDILAAQAIYRNYFADVGAVSEQVNFVAGVVELSSALTRLRVLLDRDLVERMNYGLNVDPAAFPYDITIHHAKRLLDEADRALSRFNHSYSQLSRFLGSLNGATLYATGTHTLKFTGSLTMTDLIRFGAQILRDRGAEFDRDLSDRATERLNRSPGLLLLLAAADTTDFSTGADGVTSVSVHLADYLAGKLEASADARERHVSVSLFALAWQKPTPIIREFFAAADQAWDVESGAPLLEYYDRRGADWLELKSIANDWDAFMNQTLSPPARASTASRIALDSPAHQPLLALPGPGNLDPEGFTAWLPQLVSYLEYEVIGLAPGGALVGPEGPILTSQEGTEALALFGRTNTWMDRCFHPVRDWVTIR